MRIEIDNLMIHLGYGNQPYFVYKHADIDKVHFHIVSTRIDCDTGKKIKDNYEREKTQRFIKSMEQKFRLTKDELQEKSDYRFSGSNKNLKQNIESLFGQLNQMDFISSREMYSEALKFFNIEIRSLGKGSAAFVTDGVGNPVRYPIKLSEFQERPKLYLDQHFVFGERDVASRKVRFSEDFVRELLKFLYYQPGKSSTDSHNQSRKGKGKISKRRGKHY